MSGTKKKLYSRSIELKVIRTLCLEPDSRASQDLLAKLDETHFASETARAAWRRVRVTLKKTSNLPDWEDLITDPALDDTIREELEECTTAPLSKKVPTRKAIERLDEYRKLRMLSRVGARIAKVFNNPDPVNVDDEIAQVTETLANTRSVKNFRVLRIGTNSNVMKHVDKLLRGQAIAYLPTGFEGFDSINRGIPQGSFMLIGAPTGAGKCVVGDTMVYTHRGVETMEELWAQRGEPIGNGFYALRTLVRNHLDKNAWTAGVYRTVGYTHKVNFSNGMDLEGKPEHKLWVFNEDSDTFEFRRLDEMRVGDWLLQTKTPDSLRARANESKRYKDHRNQMNVNLDWSRHMTNRYFGSKRVRLPKRLPELLNVDVAALMGLLVSEGHGSKIFHNHDRELLRDYRERMWRVFGTSLNVGYDSQRRPIKVYNSSVIEDFFVQNGVLNVTSAHKTVPACIMHGSRRVQREFLRYLFEGDGSAHRCPRAANRGKTRYGVGYGTVSRQLSRQVLVLLDSFGIKGRIRVRHGLKTKRADAQTSYGITLDPSSVPLFARTIGFVSQRKQAMVEEAAAYYEAVNFLNRTHPGHDLLYRAAQVVCEHMPEALPLGRKADWLKNLAYGAREHCSKASILRFTTWLLSDHSRATTFGRRAIKAGLPPATAAILREIGSNSWVRVTSCTKSTERKVLYDLYVPKGNSYQTNTIRSHNSLLLNQLFENFAKAGAKAGIAPLEMSNDEMLQRNMARVGSVDMTKLLDPVKKLSREEHRTVRGSFEKYDAKIARAGGSLEFYEFDEDVTIEGLTSTVKPFGLDVLGIDYLGLLSGMDGDDQWRHLMNAARYCHVWGKANKTTTVAACQLTDDGLLRYAKGLGEHAKFFWSFTVDEVAKAQGVVEIVQRKARQASDHSFPLSMNWARMTVVDADKNALEELRESRKSARATREQKEKKGGWKDKSLDWDNAPDAGELPEPKPGPRAHKGSRGGKRKAPEQEIEL